MDRTEVHGHDAMARRRSPAREEAEELGLEIEPASETHGHESCCERICRELLRRVRTRAPTEDLAELPLVVLLRCEDFVERGRA